MDTFGKDIFIIETVGMGYDEIDSRSRNLCVYTRSLNLGAIKAIIMKIPDIFVVIQADSERAD